MRVRVEPPIRDWPVPTADRPIWTGHQVTLFHPGIAAKYLAAETVSRAAGVQYRHVVVDQDVYDPLTVTLPRRQGDRLTAGRHVLAQTMPDVPVGMHPALDPAEIAAGIAALPRDAVIDRDQLRHAFAPGTPAPGTLAQQMHAALGRLLPAAATDEPPVYASQLLYGDDHVGVVARLIGDARACARHYNEAVQAFPEAGMSPLSVRPDRVEVPLWALTWGGPRRRVYVDLGGTKPSFMAGDGGPLADHTYYAPRALLMTALLRRPDRCGLFVHGTGGGNYDRVTERWWAAWAGETLAPRAVVTADLYLDFDDLPVNGPDELARAKWYAHHLPHNVDRALGLPADDPDVRAKRELLAHMDDDRDAGRRRSAFAALHRINDGLATRHAEAVAEAGRAVDRAEAGVSNAAAAGRRDWPLACYPPQALDALASQVACSGPAVLSESAE
ncbi:MAG: hypothetical protein AAF710_06795 [Planctomycetota bacterium]